MKVDGRFPRKHHRPSFRLFSERLPAATTALWRWMRAKMLPSPSKFHYTFNMRELSRVFQVSGDSYCKSSVRPSNDAVLSSSKNYVPCISFLTRPQFRKMTAFGCKMKRSPRQDCLQKQVAKLKCEHSSKRRILFAWYGSHRTITEFVNGIAFNLRPRNRMI